jgi:glutamate dehydrogenase
MQKNGGWSEYDKRVISEGGGVFLRSQKSITITPQMQKTFGIKAKTLSGEALAQRLLTAKVDLLFNGGVGTYVKAEEENSIDIGDKQNEAVRVNASSLRATMVCEGGNLGFTQKARIEYAKNGGSINLDAIDNSAGVNTSDHEVNIKILLSSLLKKQVITTDERNKILVELTDPVVKQVLRSNYEQALAISLDSERSKESLKPFIKTVEILEKSLDDFNRRDFVLPKKDAAFEEMLTPDGALVRPHLASLILYAKLFVKRIILQSDLLTRPYISGFVYKYFPKSFTTVYKHEIAHHPLKNQIIATVLADRMINQQGSSFINDHELLGDKGFALKIKAFLISNSLLGANNIRHQIYRQDYVMRTAEQYPLLFELEESVAFSAKWILHHLERDSSLEAHMILEYQERIMNVLNADIFHSKKRTINDKTLHHYYTRLPYLKFATTVIELNQKTLQSFEAKAMIFFLVLKKFSILTLLEALEAQHHLSSEQKTLQEQLQKFIEHAVITLTNKIVAFGRENEEPKAVVDAYLLAHATTLTPTLTRLDEFGLMEKKTLESIAITVNDLVLGTM